jgi:hypothetical protein
MKKSLPRKLELHRETLRLLAERDLKKAEGGIQLRTGAYTNCNECHPDA